MNSQASVKKGCRYRLFSILFIAATTGLVNILGCADFGRKKVIMNTLLAMGKEERYKQRVSRQETINYARVKSYIDNNKIKKGISRDLAMRRFGEPVIIISEAEGERWAYKPAYASWFSEEKIYLYFDTNGRLVNWE